MNRPIETESGFDEDFASDLEQLGYYSHEDHVEVEVTGVNRTNENTVVVDFEPPVGESFRKEMEIPVDPAMQTEFTKLLDYCGWNLSTASELIGERIPASYTADGWAIQYSESKSALGKYLPDRVILNDAFRITSRILVFLLWPISGLFIASHLQYAEEEKSVDEVSKLLTGYVLIFMFWGVAIVLLATTASIVIPGLIEILF